MTKHLRRSHDKTFTKKSWQNIYEEVMKIQEGEKLGEKTGEISPLHLKYIFVWFYEEVLTKHLRRRSLDKTFTKKSWQNIYEEEVLTKHLRRRSLDKTFTKKSWQNIYEEVLTKHENIYNLWKVKHYIMFSTKKTNNFPNKNFIYTKHLQGVTRLEALRIKTSFILNIFGARGRNAPGSPTTFFFITIYHII